ncbi:MAG: amidohydrolase family protein, partial [Gammaproteobacteria bacterium]|nr:amidohydrolase family protein [Gammaproteobacteria bacterium]
KNNSQKGSQIMISDRITRFWCRQRPITSLVLASLGAVALVSSSYAQDNLIPNGIADNRRDAFAFTNGHIFQPDGETLANGTLLISDGRIQQLSAGGLVPDGYFEIDLEGRYVYPGLIDVYTDYGLPDPEQVTDPNGRAENLFASERALNVNDAIKSHFRASTAFSPAEETRTSMREKGFSTVLSFNADGIARGTSSLITLGDERANESIIVPDVAAHYSLDKGTSVQSVPGSLMGSVALLRQTYLDADWFAAQDPRPFTDESLEAWVRYQDLPQIMEVDNWQMALTMDRVGDEFSSQYILKTAGDSYKQLDLIRDTGASLIVPINFPDAPAVEDAVESDEISLAELKHWELAPNNPAMLAEAGVPFAITSSGSGEDFWPNLREAVQRGLSPAEAIQAITLHPARLLGVEDKVGQLIPGALANFLITSGPLLEEESLLLENWIQGQRYQLATDQNGYAGQYRLTVGNRTYELELIFNDGEADASLLDPETGVDIEIDREFISLNFVSDDNGNKTRLAGWPEDSGWRGNGSLPDGSGVDWTLVRTGAVETEADAESDETDQDEPGAVIYPFVAYGRESLPQRQDMVIRNATVWTNEDQGVVITDVLVRDGQIAAIGPDLAAAADVLEVDGSGKHLTPGIIDEHSHIALFNINERATNSGAVRMPDVVNSENINIYRNLAGGVVAAQLLHGSANPIGGQSALIKMRWGQPAEGLLIEDAPRFIKFALGENVKRSTNAASIRYPQTRMGVEQVFVDAFTNARAYEQTWEEYDSLSAPARRSAIRPRRDLVHETMLEILNGERYVTAHSYVQSEINMLMHVADSFDFNINTFTHILEGYKVADKMARHGAGGSTFSDWWGYKWEVRYAIPYNAALMQQAGVVVAINSDDAEMSRRLNQEAAKAVKYGGVNEIDALKMITLNPAKLLHLDDRMGSIRVGKDADLVLWSDHPLSIYAVAETTWVDGIPYFDQETDRQLREQIAAERARLIAKITRDASAGDNGASGEEE